MVVAIIGILASIAIPAFSEYRLKAYKAERLQMISGMRTAFHGRNTDKDAFYDAGSGRRAVTKPFLQTAYTDLSFEYPGDVEQMAPGGPIGHSGRLRHDIVEHNTAAWQVRLRVYNCKDGMMMREERFQDGTVVLEDVYAQWINDAC